MKNVLLFSLMVLVCASLFAQEKEQTVEKKRVFAATEEGVQALTDAILEENEVAALLSAEIKELTEKLAEKKEALNEIFNADEEYKELNEQLKTKRKNVANIREDIRREIATQMRQRIDEENAAKQKSAGKVNKSGAT